MIFRKQFGKSNLTSLVKRKSRFVALWRNPSKTSMGVMAGIEAKLGPLPSNLRQTITFDPGTEFAAYTRLRTRLSMESYFYEPKSPWQKGSIENLNGRLRRFLPLDADLASLPTEAIEAVGQAQRHTSQVLGRTLMQWIQVSIRNKTDHASVNSLRMTNLRLALSTRELFSKTNLLFRLRF